MKYELTKTFGSIGVTFSGEVESQMDFFKDASFLGEFPEQCNNCKGTDLRFQYRHPKGFEYASIKCNACQYELKFGQTKDSGTLFAKGWEEPYVAKHE